MNVAKNDTLAFAGGFEQGKRVCFREDADNAKPKGPDAEGITVDGSGMVYLASEHDNSAKGVNYNMILMVNPNESGTRLVAQKQWDLTATLPQVSANMGIEAVEWLANGDIAGKLIDQNTGSAFDAAKYPNAVAGGVFFAALEDNGHVYAYVLNKDETVVQIADIDAKLALSQYDAQNAYQIVNGIYHTVVSRDIVKRHRINKQDLFDRVVKFIIENVGKTFSANSISTFLKSEHRKVSVESIYNYLRWLEQAFIIYPCERYDLQGKSILKTQEKYYLADVSLKYALLGYNRKMLDGAMENIVFLELKRRGYDVYIGKNDTKEINFVATRRDERIYVQVCVQLSAGSDREVGNLMEIKDHYPKYVVTLNDMDVGIENGIKIVHLQDFLLAETW